VAWRPSTYRYPSRKERDIKGFGFLFIMLIAVDIDDVLAEYVDAFTLYLNKELSIPVDRYSFYNLRFEDVLDLDVQGARLLVSQFESSIYFSNIVPVPGSQEALTKLAKDHNLISVTSRLEEIAEPTKEWIDQHFPHLISEIFHTDYHAVRGSRTKSGVCQELGVDLIIDDNPPYAQECLEVGISVKMLRQPWNQDYFGAKKYLDWEALTRDI
jgi:uncharacterized HAD superfamily protein